jgi:hypothetical protein
MRAMVRTTFTGIVPMAVSPESITALVPSKHGVGHVGDLGRVGLGEVVIDSSIWVAVMTGRP